MSWVNLRELIFHERQMLNFGARPEFLPESPFESESSALLTNHLRTKSRIDELIRAFSCSLEWPELTPTEKFFLVARFDYAWEVVSLLNTCHDRHPVIPCPAGDTVGTPELIQWLLIDIWPYGCGRFLQKQRFRTTSPAPEAVVASANAGNCLVE